MDLIPSLNIGNLLTGLVKQVFVQPVGSSTSINGVFIFDTVLDDEVMVMNDITDHYVEANYAIQDHITQKPIEITIRGYVGELVYTAPQSIFNALVPSPIQSVLDSLAPKFTSQAAAFFGKIQQTQNQINQVIGQTNNLIDLLSNKTVSSTKQQKAYNAFQNLRTWQTLCDINTPFQLFQNMAVKTITAIQKNESNMVSEFSVTFKQIRTVAEMTPGYPVAIGRVADSMLPTINKGQITGIPMSTPQTTSLMQMAVSGGSGFN